MMNELNALFCTPLDRAGRAQLSEALASDRATQGLVLLQRALSAEAQRRLGPGARPLNRRLEGVLGLASADEAAFRDRLADWRLLFLLATAETIPAAWSEDAMERLARVALEDGARVPGWDIPVVAFTGLGLPSPFPPGGDDGPPVEGLPLADSLSAAHDLLARLWPEVVAWTRVMVPAFADQGVPPTAGTHYSGSRGAGSPFMLSRVQDPFLHAEDIVHELQHSRLHLLVPREALGRRGDEACRYVSPYRQDPRPLRGLVLGVHAFVAVNELRLRAMRAGGFTPDLRMLLRSHRLNLFAFRTLVEAGALSPAVPFAEIGAALAAQHGAIESAVSTDEKGSFDAGFDAHVARVVKAAREPLQNLSPAFRDWDENARVAAELGARAVEVLHAR